MNIILASSSPYRKQLLSRILDDFETESPNINEQAHVDEAPDKLAIRLAQEKAQAIAQHHQDALVIGSDQVAWLDGQQLCKPGNRENNIQQLMSAQGKDLTFYTGLVLINCKTGSIQRSVERYNTQFRSLTEEQISRYVDKEQAFDCAGGFKMEGRGIALFERIYGDDPNTLIGLPIIRLIKMLEQEGIRVL